MAGKRKRYTEEQIVRLLREAEVSGLSVGEFTKKHGISEATFFRWKKKFGGMDVEDGRRLKELEAENTRLKKLVADRSLEIEILKEANRKKW